MTTLDKVSRSVTRLTVDSLGSGHGRDGKRRLVCTLAYGDLLILRPQRTKRAEMLRLVDLYAYALRCKANLARLEKARERLEKQRQRKKERAIKKEAAK